MRAGQVACRAPRVNGAGRLWAEAFGDHLARGGCDSPLGDSRSDRLGGDSPSQQR